jgi:hypothetical protein
MGDWKLMFVVIEGENVKGAARSALRRFENL